jgi:hypothetical protein
MDIDLSPEQKVTDDDIYIIHNFTDARARIDFIANGDLMLNETLLMKKTTLRESGSNVVYNDSNTREMHYIVNGRNSSKMNL